MRFSVPASRIAHIFLCAAFPLTAVLCLLALLSGPAVPDRIDNLPSAVILTENGLCVREYGDGLSGAVRDGGSYRLQRHMLTCHLRVWNVIPDGRGEPAVSVLPDLASSDGKTVEYAPRFRPVIYCCLGAVAILLALGVFFLVRAPADGRAWSAAFCICAFQAAMLLLYRLNAPDIFLTESDAHGYFHAVRQMLDLDFQSPARYTIGVGLVYLPFMLITGAKSAFDLTQLLSTVSAVFVYPGALLLLYFTMRHYLKSTIIPLLGILSWLAASHLFFIIESSPFGGIFSPGGIFHAEPGADYIYHIYALTLHSLSQISEPWSIFFTALSLSCVRFFRRPVLRGVLTGAVFGFACLVRINNIFFAPAILYLFLLEDGEMRRSLKHFSAVSFAACAGFLAVFGIQLVQNALNFGNPLTFPYVLHAPELYRGFRFVNLPRSAGFYFRCFAPLFGVLAAGVLTCRDAERRDFIILSAMPLIVFFCGITELGQNYRFLYPVYTIAATAAFCSSGWDTLNRWERTAVPLCFVLLMIPAWPYPLAVRAAEVYGMPWLPAALYLPAALLVVRLIVLKKWCPAVFFCIAAVFTAVPIPVVGAGLFMALIAFAVYESVKRLWGRGTDIPRTEPSSGGPE